MTGEHVALNLLNRTKYAQNRTKYYTVRNTVLSQTERPLFVTGSLKDASSSMKSLSLRKSFLNRRSSKRGPFQKLSLPHEYFKTLGDPLYYSNQELVSACVTASSENMCDSYFWKQICEKIREVRDVIPISDLLKCLTSVTKVNHYDRDSFRVLSREFVDDMSKLSLDEVSQLLHCYYKQNVYSCDLVNSVGLKVISDLDKELSNILNQDSSNKHTTINSDSTNTSDTSSSTYSNVASSSSSTLTMSNSSSDSSTSSSTTKSSGLFERLKNFIPSNKPTTTNYNFRHISKILKYCHYFNYSNPDFYLLMANLFISNSNNMDLSSRLEMFTYLDPKKLNLIEYTTLTTTTNTSNDINTNITNSDSISINSSGTTSVSDSSSTNKTSTTSNTINSKSFNLLNHNFLTSILNSFDGFDPYLLNNDNFFDLNTFLSSKFFRNSDHSKLLNDLSTICSSCSLLSSSILRYLSNCFYLNAGYRDFLDVLLTLLSNCSSQLLPLMSKLSSLDLSSDTLTTSSTDNTAGDTTSVSDTDSINSNSSSTDFVSTSITGNTTKSTSTTSGSNSDSLVHSLKSPFSLSLQHMFMDSLFNSIHVLNTCWRLKLGCVDQPNNLDSPSLLSFTLKDNNIHSSFLREFAKLSFSETELGHLSRVATSLNQYGCKGQTVRNLTSTFESFTALLSNKNALSLSSKLVDDLNKSLEFLSLEIIRQLVDFDNNNLYRVALSLNYYESNCSDSSNNSHLNHYLKSFPKLTRSKSDTHSITFSNPFTTF